MYILMRSSLLKIIEIFVMKTAIKIDISRYKKVEISCVKKMRKEDPFYKVPNIRIRSKKCNLLTYLSMENSFSS